LLVTSNPEILEEDKSMTAGSGLDFDGTTLQKKSHIENQQCTEQNERKYKPHVCDVCGKSFSLRSYLRQHFLIHTGEKPFTCTECGKGFTQRSNLKTHMRLHTGEKPHVCLECGKGYITLSSLTAHEFKHSGKVKPFVCDVCEHSFAQKGDLKTHALIHTGEKRHECSVVGKGSGNVVM
jgi:uncharacterized Zn-finger protein